MEISVVIPVYNEEDNIWPLYHELKHALDKLKKDYEIIFVDDGSKDKTFEKLLEISKQDKKLKAIQFAKNFQKAAALTAGFKDAVGKIIITLDGDLQDDPNEISKLLDNIKDCDLVVGWRYNRNDGQAKKVPSFIFNLLIKYMTGLGLHDSDCNFRAIRNYVISDLNIYGGLYRYIPVIAHNSGYNVKEVKINHRKRLHGHSKYGIKRIFSGTLDLMTVKFLMSYIKRPMHLFGSFGFIFSFVGFILGVYLLIIKYAYHSRIGDRPLLFLSILLIVVGIQFFSMGLIGELITNYNSDVKNQFIIKRKI